MLQEASLDCTTGFQTGTLLPLSGSSLLSSQPSAHINSFLFPSCSVAKRKRASRPKGKPLHFPISPAPNASTTTSIHLPIALGNRRPDVRGCVSTCARTSLPFLLARVRASRRSFASANHSARAPRSLGPRMRFPFLPPSLPPAAQPEVNERVSGGAGGGGARLMNESDVLPLGPA